MKDCYKLIFKRNFLDEEINRTKRYINYRFRATLLVLFTLNIIAVDSSIAAIDNTYTESFESGALPAGWVATNSPEFSWSVDTTSASDGSVSIRSGAIPDVIGNPLSERSAIEFTDDFSVGHLLVFDVFYTPTRLANNFRVTLDRKEKIFLYEADATTNWRTFAIHIPAGQHTVLFENYIRKGDTSAAWIDNLRFIDTAPLASTPGNILVASGGDELNTVGYLHEYDGDGLLVWEVPLGPMSSGVRMGDVVFTGQKQLAIAKHVDDGVRAVINLDIIDPKTLNTTVLSMDPAVQICCGSNSGGLAVLDNRLFAASWDRSGTTEDGGIVTRDLGVTSTQTHNATQAYKHVSIGLDNKLYALRIQSDIVDVFDPTSMIIEKNISLPATTSNAYQAVTANAVSELFVVTNFYSSKIEKIIEISQGEYIAAGELLTQKDLDDIDINSSGRIAAAGRGSSVVITDETFSFSTEFYAEGNQYGGDAKVGIVKSTIIDADGDGMADSWESANGLDPTVNDAGGDLDGDLLLNYDEYLKQSDPQMVDTDADGLNDGPEVHTYNTNPIIADTDVDGLKDGAEVNAIPATDPLVADTDADGLSDGDEVNTYLTDATVADTDGDGLTDGEEVNTTGTDPTLVDTDIDGMPDKWELDNGLDPLVNTDAALDPDSDGLTNVEEFTAGTNTTVADTDGDNLSDGDEVKVHMTNPLVVDTDGDGVNDGLEIQAGLDPNNGSDAALDSDGDGLSNLDELAYGTDPNNTDSDSDGLTDGAEVTSLNPTNPTDADSDNDSLTDGAEVNTHNTDPNKADSDSDGLNDGAEINTHSTDPLLSDTDNDGLSDGEEINTYFTLPTNPDTDGDGVQDGAEVTAGTDPLVADNNTVVDTDGDGMPDAWETQYGLNPNSNADATLDPDGDGVSNLGEFLAGTDPLVANNTVVDSDGDGMPDAWETQYGLDPNSNADATLDPDGDGVSNLDEFLAGTDPLVSNNTVVDTDSDGMPDAWETAYGFDPNSNADASLDPDGDGVSNLDEFLAQTDPTDLDSDNDGMQNAWEISNGLNHEDSADAVLDADSDGANNVTEFQQGTDPNNADSDDDGMPDGWEINNNLNPLINDAGMDPDGDGVSNIQEFSNDTDPNIFDTDNTTPKPTSTNSGGGSFSPINVLLISLYLCLGVYRKRVYQKGAK